MLTRGGSLDIEAFDTRLRHAVTQARLAHREADPSDLEIRMHPFDVEDLELAASARWDTARSLNSLSEQRTEPGVQLRWRDIAVVKDMNVPQGSPQLRSSWRIAL